MNPIFNCPCEIVMSKGEQSVMGNIVLYCIVALVVGSRMGYGK